MSRASAVELGRSTARASLWATGSNFGGRLIAFASTLVMARLLEPADFGIVAIGLISIGMLDSFRNLGVGEALIYRQRPGDRDSSTAFWIALVVGALLSLTAWALSPVAARFFGNAEAEQVISALSVLFVVEATMAIHATRAQRDLEFEKRAAAEFSKAGVKAVVAVGSALLGYGFWSLVFGQIAGALAGALAYWRLVSWRPAFEFDREAASGLISYGGVLILLGALSYTIARADQFMIGRFLDETLLGYYAISFSMVDLLIANPARTIGLASYSAFSRVAADRGRLRERYFGVLFAVSLISVPLGVGLCITTADLVIVFLSHKWLPCVPVMQALACFAMAHGISYSAGDVLKATGRAADLVKLSLGWCLVSLPLLWFSAPGGIVLVAWLVFGMQLVAALVALTLVMRQLSIGLAELFQVLAPAFIAGASMAGALWLLTPLLPHSPNSMALGIRVGVGALVYGATVQVLRPDALRRLGSLDWPGSAAH